MARTVEKRDLTVFDDLNERESVAKKKIPWQERYLIIKEQFPSIDRLNWAEAFKNVDLFGRVLRDILRIDQSLDSRTGPGPRPVLDEKRARERLRQLLGQDFSYSPFGETFDVMTAGRSMRGMAAKTGLSVKMIFQLKHGEREPDLYIMEQIAKAFNKDPSYFVEYRTAFIISALCDQMDKSPETTVDLYKKLSHGWNNN